MFDDSWRDISYPWTESDRVWESFHENTKVSQYDPIPPNDFIVSRMKELLESLSFDGYETIRLPEELTPLSLSAQDALIGRITGRALEPCRLSLRDLATILHYAYGITRDNTNTAYPRSFRTVPSGGALYPFELFFHCKNVESLKPGLYHYNPVMNAIHYIKSGDQSMDIAELLVPIQANLAHDTSLMFFLTAFFERSTFKYGARGYRYIFLEGGHIAQNINLTTTAMGLGSINICGYFDRKTDEYLGVDGLSGSAVYLVGVGQHRSKPE